MIEDAATEQSLRDMLDTIMLRPEQRLPPPYYVDEWTTLYCGDCRNILSLLGPVDLVLTDPPYGVGFSYPTHNDDPKMYHGFIWPILELAESKIADGWVCVYQAAKYASSWSSWFPREYRLFALPKTFVQMLPGKGAQWATDYALVWKKGEPHFPTVRAVRDWCVAATSDMSLKAKGHPCPRPLSSLLYLVSALSDRGILILDPFAGSGTTLVAAKQLGRKSIGIEIEEKYCAIAADRLRHTTPSLFTARPKPPEQLGLLND